MKLAILSDTHDNLQNVQFARLHILAEDVDAVIHCGDLTEVEILDYFGDFKIFCAYGNGDFADEVEERLHWLNKSNQAGHELDFSLEGKRIYLTHGHLYNHLEQAIASGSFDYVFHGHSHRFRDEMVGKTRVINPGSLGGRKVEPRGFVVLDLETGVMKRICEPF